MIDKKKIKKYYLDNDYDGLEKEILSSELSEKETTEVLDYIKEIKEQQKPKVVKMFKELFKDEISDLFVINEEIIEPTEEFQAEVNFSFTEVKKLKNKVYKILKDKVLLHQTRPEAFYDYAILIEKEIFVMNKYMSIITVKYYRRIIDIMAKYNCSRLQADNRARAEQSYCNYLNKTKDMKSLDEFILLLKKRGQIE